MLGRVVSALVERMTAISTILLDADEVIQYQEADRVEQLVPIFGFVPQPFAQFIADPRSFWCKSRMRSDA